MFFKQNVFIIILIILQIRQINEYHKTVKEEILDLLPDDDIKLWLENETKPLEEKKEEFSSNSNSVLSNASSE